MITENMTTNACALFTTIVKNVTIENETGECWINTDLAKLNTFVPAKSRAGVITSLLNTLKEDGFAVFKNEEGRRCFKAPVETVTNWKNDFAGLSENPEDWADEPEIEEEEVEAETISEETSENLANVTNGGPVYLVDSIELPEE